MKRISLTIGLALLASLLLVPTAPAGAAKPKPGFWTTPIGELIPDSGVQFKVKRDGRKAKVRDFSFSVPMPAPHQYCGGSVQGSKGKMKVKHGHFEYESALPMDPPDIGFPIPPFVQREEASGDFVTKRKAVGTMRLQEDFEDPSLATCDSGTVSWTARLERK